MKSLFYRLRLHYQGHVLPLMLNMVGMAIAFVAAIVILIQVHYDVTYDTFHDNADRIYRLHMVYPTENPDSLGRTRTLSVPFVKELLNTDEVLPIKSVSYCQLNANYKTWHGAEADFSLPYCLVDSSFVDIFSLTPVSGNFDDFKKQNNVALIPESVAVKQWGTSDVVGKALSMSPDTLTICGVYKDIPSNSMVKNYIYIPETNAYRDDTNWNNWVYEIYVELESASSYQTVKNTLDKSLNRIKHDFNTISPLDLDKWQVELVSIHDLHYISELVEYNVPVVTRESVLFLFVICLIIVVIAGVNFANCQVALIPKRIKGINIRRVLGAGRSRLVLLLLGESISFVVLSWIFAILFLLIFADEWLFGTSVVRADFMESLSVFAFTFVLAIIVGVLIGLYPALYLTRVPIQIVLKRHMGLSRIAGTIQDILLCLQLFCSMALVTCSYTMLLQNRYLYEGGTIDKEHLAFAFMKDTIPDSKLLYEKMNAVKGVKGTALSLKILTTQDEYVSWVWEHVIIRVLQVSMNYHQVLDIDIIEGREFCEKDTFAMIFNEAAMRKYPNHISVGSRFGTGEGFAGFEIVGICKDVNFMSLRNEIAPMAFILTGDDNLTCVNVRLNNGTVFAEVKTELEKVLDEVDTGYKHNFKSLDDIYTSTYRYENLMANRIALLAFVAIMISVMGLCAMVILNSEYRVKDIAVKRVLGAGTWQLVKEQLARYLGISVLAAVLCIPVYYYFIGEWLTQFYYHVEVTWWLCAVPLLIMILMIQCMAVLLMMKYINNRPVDVLKYE